MLRGFYALERTRTVFYVQCVIAATNIVLAVVLHQPRLSAGHAAGLVIAYAGAYLVGALISYSLLRRTCSAASRHAGLLRFLVRLLIAAGISTAVAWGVKVGLAQVWAPGEGGHVLACPRRHRPRRRRGVPRAGPGDPDHGGDQRHGPGHRSAPAVTARP